MSPIRYLGVGTHPRYLRGDSCSWKDWSKRQCNCKGVGSDGDGRRGRLGGRPGPGPAFRAPVWPVWDAELVPGHSSGTAPSTCAVVGDPGHAALCAAARPVSTMRRRPCRVDALGQWTIADDPRAARDPRDVGPSVALASGYAVLPVLVGHRRHGRRGGGRLRPGTS